MASWMAMEQVDANSQRRDESLKKEQKEWKSISISPAVVLKWDSLDDGA